MAEPRTYTSAEREEIVGRIRAGLSEGKRVAASAVELGISEATFYRWVRESARAGAGAGPAPVRKRRAPPGRGYSPEERSRILEAIRRRIRRGQGVLEAAVAEGISDGTYYNWIRAEKDMFEPPTMRPVALVPAPSLALTVSAPQASPPPLTIVAPGGYRVEGLTIESAAALLRALR